MDLDKREGALDNPTQVNISVCDGAEVQEPRVGMEFDLDEQEGALNILTEGNIIVCDEAEVQEPYVGMEFDSEDDAKRFYFEYARKIGFVVRIMQRRCSETDGRVVARRLGCNKQGFSPNYGTIGPDKKPRSCAREGCKATILVKLEKSGKWVVSRFVKEHNHSLVVTEQGLSTYVSFSITM